MTEPDIEREGYEFWKLATHYARHYHEDDLVFQPQSCLVCEAIRAVDVGQMEVVAMLDGRDNTGTEDADDIRTRPF